MGLFNKKGKKAISVVPPLEFNIGAEIKIECSHCKQSVSFPDMAASHYVCPLCNECNRIPARTKIQLITDGGSFREHNSELTSANPLNFPEYGEKLEEAKKRSGENESVICGKAKIGGYTTCIFVMDSRFMMGSMGCVSGDKITALFEYATERELPVIGIISSGGARMQEGMLALIQMAKTTAAIKRHGDAGHFYCSVLTDPTMGGITASIALLSDIVIAEPKALIGFAGRRVMEQTTHETLPENFQTAEFQLENGFIDAIVERKELCAFLANILALHHKSSD